MTRSVRSSPIALDRRLFTRAMLLWAVAFTLLFAALSWATVLQQPRTLGPTILQYATTLGLGWILGATTQRMEELTGARRWIRLLLLALIAGMVESVIGVSSLTFVLASTGDTVWLSMAERVARTSLFFTWIFALELAILQIGRSGARIRNQDREIAEARAQAAQAQLAMLRYQLNPHFLFNTLNALSTLVVTRRNAEAEEMIAKLSTFLRASLTSGADGFVRLDDELSVVREYLEIEGVRFGERLRVEFACDPDLSDILLPSFILQPLLENAIKYAVEPALVPVAITVEARLDGDDLLLMVDDTGTSAKTTTRGGTGVGLRNIAGRLAAVYGDRGSLEAVPRDGGFLAIIRLPVECERTSIAA